MFAEYGLIVRKIGHVDLVIDRLGNLELLHPPELVRGDLKLLLLFRTLLL